MNAVDQAARQAGTPKSDRQADAGNYNKGHVRIHGLDITIENAKGSRRRPEWPPLSAHYGYVKRTLGADGDHVDVFIGPDPEATAVFIVDQTDEKGKFDEHKCMLGFASKEKAIAAYRKCYSPGWKVGKVSACSIENFKRWLSMKSHAKPFADVKHSVFLKSLNSRRGSMSETYSVDSRDELHRQIVEQYASKGPRNSPGQLDLFDGLEKRSGKRQTSFNWDEHKHPRASDGKFSKGSGGGGSPKVKPPGKGNSPAMGPKEKPKLPAGSIIDDLEKKKVEPVDIGDRVTFEGRGGVIVSDASSDNPDAEWRVQFDDGSEHELSGDQLSHEDGGGELKSPPPGGEEKPKPTPKPEPKSAAIAKPEPESDPKPAPKPADTLRGQAASSTQQLDSDYEFARKSSVSNAGEDLKGSARHKRNAWRSLEDAESNGTAEKLVTRANLLKNEPHNIAAHVDVNPEVALLMHLAMKSFPAKPDYDRYKTSDGTREKHRSDYLDSYRNIKAEAEKIAAKPPAEKDKKHHSNDIYNASKALANAVSSEIKRLRGQKGDSMMDYSSAEDKYNAMANNLVSFYKGVAQPSLRKSSPYNKVREFSHDNRDVEDTKDAVLAVIEGGPLKPPKEREETEKWNPADLYVGIAERKGGKDLGTKTADDATSYMVDKMGLRGVQFGNSVSDEEREHHSKKCAEAMVDLADVLGLPIEAISLGGKLGVAIGARGRGTALAHYEPSTKVINLTRKKGVGSLAHEWGHGLDNSIKPEDTRSDFEKGISRLLGGEPDGHFESESPNKETETGKAMVKLRDTWKTSGFQERYIKVLADRPGDFLKAAKYWDSNVEKFARTFERYVQVKLESAGRKNTYLAGIETKDHKQGGLWPTDDEVKKMTPAFDAFFDAYRKEKLGVNERVKYSAQERSTAVHELIIEYYRGTHNPSRPEQSSQGDGKPKTVTGSQGDKGHFVTIDGNAVFIDESATKTRIGKIAKEEVGDNKDHIRDFSSMMADAHEQLTSAGTDDDLRSFLSAGGYGGRRASTIVAKAKRAKDASKIPGFDKLVDLARSSYGHLLNYGNGESVGSGDDEAALLDRLRDGFDKSITRTDSRVVDLARQMWKSRSTTADNSASFDFGANFEQFSTATHNAIVELYSNRRKPCIRS